MKNLRQLLCRSGLLRSQKRRGRPEDALRSNASRRQLRSETLEKRELLAGDILASSHNYSHPYDVNDDGQYSARDALAVINYLSTTTAAAGETLAGGEKLSMYYDVNADNRVSAADALGVINALSRGEGVNELVEFFLTARTVDDQAIAPDANGEINVDVDQPFDLEVSYNDLRPFNIRDGIFQLYVDLSVSQPDVLVPILNETQRLVIGQEFNDPGTGSGTLTFSIENSSTTYVSPLINRNEDVRQEFLNALAAFGYSTSDYTIASVPTDDVAYDIHFVGDQFGNLDLPNITVTASGFAAPVSTQTIEFAPLNPDGSVNSSAVKFNINTKSRTFNNNEKFYENLPAGSFDPTNGFTGVGGLGRVPSSGGGIPDLTNDGSFIRPFDAFSLRVKLVQPVTDFVVGVNPGEDAEATLLYGFVEGVNPDTGDPELIDAPPLTQDQVLIDENAFVTFNALSGNQNPVVSAPVTATFTEDDAVSMVNLLTNASDPDGDTLSITTPTISGDQSGISVNGNIVTVTPAAYGSLNTGQSSVINFSYNVIDGNGGSVAQTASITITGITDVVNQNPVVSTPVTATFTEDDAVSMVNLLTNASDPDAGDVLSITTPTIGGDQSGISVNGNIVTVTPAAYGSLNTGQSSVINFSYNVIDGNGGSVAQTASITITGITDVVNQNPVVSAPVTATFTEDDAVAMVNLLTNASDPDGDTLSITTPTISGDQTGISVNGNIVTVTPAAYGSLNTGQSSVINFSYNVIDGNGGSAAQTASITITGITDVVNQNPVVSAPVTATFTEDDAVAMVNLLTNASDPDGDTLSITTPTISGDQSGISVNGNIVTVTPSAYSSLIGGQSAVIGFSYNVIDGNGGSVAQTATITINGVNRNPVVSAPVSATFTEDDAVSMVNLLTNASDPDGNTLSITTPTISGNQSGISVNGNIVTVTPSAYGDLNDGQSAVISFSYNVTDGMGGSVAQTATITITGITDIVNQPPVVTAPVSATFSEQDANSSVNLLTGASDPEGDTLGISGLTLVSGDARGITPSGTSLSVNPNAYGFLTDAQNSVIVYSYTVIDGNGGSTPQSATITINGFNDPPRARDDNNLTAFVDTTVNINVLGNDDAGEGETQTLTVISAVSDDGNATVSPNANGTVAFTADSGFIGNTSFTYTIQDSGGKQSSATVRVSVQNFNPSSIGGSIFIDHVENLGSVIEQGADPIRNGVKESDESGLGGVLVNLFSAAANNSTGQDVHLQTLTNLHGGYEFGGVAPGSFTITAMVDGEPISQLSTKVIYLGESELHVGIGSGGGQTFTEINFPLLGTRGNAMDTVDILASSYLRTNPSVGAGTNGGREGGLVSLASDGSQNFFIAGEGFDGVVFAELVVNQDRDAALLTIIEEDGDVLSTRLSADHFVVSGGNGLGIQFFGGINDFDFVAASNDASIHEEFAQYRNAIDQVLSEMSL